MRAGFSSTKVLTFVPAMKLLGRTDLTLIKNATANSMTRGSWRDTCSSKKLLEQRAERHVAEDHDHGILAKQHNRKATNEHVQRRRESQMGVG